MRLAGGDWDELGGGWMCHFRASIGRKGVKFTPFNCSWLWLWLQEMVTM